MILARLLSATPQTDGEHWDLQFRWHIDAWHTDVYAQNPAPFQRGPQTGNMARAPYPWRPNVPGIWGSFDALFPDKYGFTVKVNTSHSPTTLDIYGATPVNALPAGNAPQCPLEATISPTGGSIVSGNYLFAIAGSASGPTSRYLINATVPPGITTATITISGVVWSAAAAAIGVYAGKHSLAMHSINGADWTGSSADAFGNPTVFTIGSMESDGLALPDPVFNSFLFQAKTIMHGGVWGAAATAVGISGGHATATIAGAGWGVAGSGQWAGYIVSSYGAGAGIGGLGPLNFLVTSNTVDTLTFSGSHGPAVGVAIVMRAAVLPLATAWASGTTYAASAIVSYGGSNWISGPAGNTGNEPDTSPLWWAQAIGDPNFVNSFAPSGLTANAEAGNLIRIIAGTGANQPPIVISFNTSTMFALGTAWAVKPDATSVYIIEVPTWPYSLPTGTIPNNATGNTGFLGSIPVLNFQFGSLLVEGITVDVNGNWSVERYAPIREIFVPPPSVALNTGYYIITPAAGNAVIDLFNGATQDLLLNGTAVTVLAPVFTGGVVAAGLTFTLYLDQDATGGRAIPTFASGAGGFAADVGTWQIDGTASTRTTYVFEYSGSAWGLTVLPPATGGPIT